MPRGRTALGPSPGRGNCIEHLILCPAKRARKAPPPAQWMHRSFPLDWRVSPIRLLRLWTTGKRLTILALRADCFARAVFQAASQPAASAGSASVRSATFAARTTRITLMSSCCPNACAAVATSAAVIG